MRRAIWIVWAPLALGLYNVLRICSDEAAPVPTTMCLRPMAVTALLTLLLLWALRFLVPGLAKRAVIVTAFLIVFLNYTLLVMMVGMVEPLGPLVMPGLTNPIVAFGLVAALMTAMVVVMRRSRSDFTTASNALGIFATVLLVFVFYQSAKPLVDGSRSRWVAAADQVIDATAAADIRPAENLPDVYYIIVDGYARQDVLQTLYGYDNSEFLYFLSDQGFHTPSHSSSNYPQTYLSLSSSLNLSYLDNLSTALTTNSDNRRPLHYLIKHNSAMQLLRRAGYRLAYLSTSYSAAGDGLQVDACYCQPLGLNRIENTLLFSTPLIYIRPLQVWQHDMYRQEILATFDNLVDAAGTAGPKFIFAHVLSPHPPFIFGPNGEKVTPATPLFLNDGSHFPFSREEYRSGYVSQLTFLNSRLQDVLLKIQAQSTTPPIIILQADHGPGLMLDWEDTENTNATERLGIFSSYLVPEDFAIQIPETMTQVNTFRILLNAILGTRFALEEDHSYLALWKRPYEFVPAPITAQDKLTEQ